MNYFVKALATNDFVFVSIPDASNYGQVLLVLKSAFTGDSLTLSDALNNKFLQGSIIFSRNPVQLTTIGEVDNFKAAVSGILNQNNCQRAIIWITDSKNPVAANSSCMGFGNDDLALTSDFNIVVTSGLSIRVTKSIQISVDIEDRYLNFSKTGLAAIDFIGNQVPGYKTILKASINMQTASRGTLEFSTSVLQNSMISKWKPGFQFVFSANGSITNATREFLPLFTPALIDNYINYYFRIDPVNLFNESVAGNFTDQYNARRSFFNFLNAPGFDSFTLKSNYHTIYNEDLLLWPVAQDNNPMNRLPSRFVFTRSFFSGAEDLFISPEGDFIIRIEDAVSNTDYQLLCALSGSEYISFLPQTINYGGDRITFISHQPAFISEYPLPVASPTGPPVQAEKKLLDNSLSTSYCYILRDKPADNCHYVSQPQGMEMYGYDQYVHNGSIENPLGFIELGFTLPASNDKLFPMVPYAGVETGDGVWKANREQVLNIEWGIIFPVRRTIISSIASSVSFDSEKSLFGRFAEEEKSSTTPSGMIAKYSREADGTDKCKEFILGQSNTDLGTINISFSEPGKDLTDAMMTKDLFLVIANNKYLGQLKNSVTPDPGPAFNNTIEIEDWNFNVRTGYNSYGNYSNVIIIKGREGVMFDKNLTPDKWLISTPDKWTQSSKFAAPSNVKQDGSLSEPDPGQLSVFTRWLTDYFKYAAAQESNPYFQDLLSKAASPFWTGILFINVDINYSKVPDGLIALLGGISDKRRFQAHHLGINLSQVAKGVNGPEIKDLSSFFGLIYYKDLMFVEHVNGKVEPVLSQSSADYDFKVLVIKVLFNNSSVKSFENFAQLRINKMLRMNVTGMSRNGNPMNAIIIEGLYQKRNNIPYYTLEATDKYAFLFDNNLFKKIEISGATLSINNQLALPEVDTIFNLNGFFDFSIMKAIKDKGDVPIDILSFGSGKEDPSDIADEKGLHFYGLGIRMKFNIDTGASVYEMQSSGLRFDLASSTIRENSLYKDFALGFSTWLDEVKEYKPEEYGYAGIVTEFNLSAIPSGDKKCWYGIEFKLDLGTPGELAGKVSLDSYLLMAWAPDSSGDAQYQFFLGLKLPGLGGTTKIIDLQNVLKLSIGQSQLLYVPAKAGDPPDSFMLLLTDIALKFMGFLKIPPNGSTNFYLFGNKEAQGKASSLGWYAYYKKD